MNNTRSMNHVGQLVIPHPAATDPHATEITRIWLSGDQQYVAVRAHTWPDPAAWGLMLVDLAKHVANAYAEEKGVASASILSRIKEGLDAEWSSPTDTPTGAMLE